MKKVFIAIYFIVFGSILMLDGSAFKKVVKPLKADCNRLPTILEHEELPVLRYGLMEKMRWLSAKATAQYSTKEHFNSAVIAQDYRGIIFQWLPACMLARGVSALVVLYDKRKEMHLDKVTADEEWKWIVVLLEELALYYILDRLGDGYEEYFSSTDKDQQHLILPGVPLAYTTEESVFLDEIYNEICKPAHETKLRGSLKERACALYLIRVIIKDRQALADSQKSEQELIGSSLLAMIEA